MKFSEQWLREWVNPSVSTDELCHQLTMAGLEVDAVEPVAGEFTGVVVAEVLSVEPHPDADKLRVTQVNIGSEEPVQIVCGAANVRPGLRVPCATVGAKLPGNFKIKKAKLRGVPSNGMLASASELGLAESSDGLMELPADAPVGVNFRDYLQLDDVTIELGLTPNRGDCLSIAGIARETGVLNNTDVTGAESQAVASTIEDSFSIKVDAAEACPRYLGRVIRGVNVGDETPLWMQERLRRSGIRSLSAVVDVTNYVLLELGQPMHAFDLEKLQGGIQVRMANSGEKLKLLNDDEVKLDSNTLVIADRGFPFWPMIETVDISLVDDIPTVLQVLDVIRPNFCIGRVFMAQEFLDENLSETHNLFSSSLTDIPITYEAHIDFKKRVPEAIGLIRTADTTQYANMILESA